MRHTRARIAGEEVINAEESQDYENKSAFSKNVTSEKQVLASRSHSRAAKRKRGKSTLSYEEDTLRLQKRNLERLIKQGVDDENLNFFRSLIPYVKQLPRRIKSFLSSQFQNMVADETGALQNNLLHALASSTAPIRTVLITVGL
jgi:hypothetical protein